MKLIKILSKYRNGVRLSSLFLVILMTWSIFQCVFVYAQFWKEYSHSAVFRSAPAGNAYYAQIFVTSQDITSGTDLKAAEKAVESLSGNPDVAHVFPIRGVTGVTFGNEATSIILYEPEMITFFPRLKSLGIQFSRNPEGCILGSDLFSGYGTGDEVDLTFNQGGGKKETASFPIAGKLNTPYTYMDFGSSSSVLTPNRLFSSTGNVVIMPATDAVMTKLSALARRIEMQPNFIVVFRDGVSPEEQEATLAAAAPKYIPFSFSKILENEDLEPSLKSRLAQALVQPLFLAIAAFVAYLSILVLTFKKKEKEMAVWYLCGGNRLKCGIITFVYFSLLSLVPVLLNIGLILYWPNINWNGIWLHVMTVGKLQYTQLLGEELYIKLLGILNILATRFAFNKDCLMVVYGYYGVSILLALAATVGSMLRHTPLTYLRGANK